MMKAKDTSAINLLLIVVHLFSIPFIYVYSIWLSSFIVTVKHDIDIGIICVLLTCVLEFSL